MVLSNKMNSWAIFLTVVHTLVYATVIYFNCYDLKDVDFSGSWVGMLDFLVVCCGLGIFGVVAVLMTFVAFKKPAVVLEEWSVWITLPTVPFLLSACLQGKWILAWIILNYFLINVFVVKKYISKGDELSLSSRDDDDDDGDEIKLK